MRIAIPAAGTTPDSDVEVRFARTAQFLVYDDERDTWEVIENTQVLNAPQGAGIQAAETLARHGIAAVLAANCGPKAFNVLRAANIDVYIGVHGSVADALQAFRHGDLQRATAPNVEGHW